MRTLFIPVLSVLVIFSTLLGACGSDREWPYTADPAPELCSGNWKTIFSPEQPVIDFKPETLTWSEGRLFTTIYGGLEAPPIVSFPDSGGTPTTLHPGNHLAFWVDGPRLLYTASSGASVRPEDDPRGPVKVLYAMPVTGGASIELLTTRLGDSLPSQIIKGLALDEQALYWALSHYRDGERSWSVWRAPLDGSGDQKLATLPDLHFPVVVPAADRLFIYSSEYSSTPAMFSVPKSGGEATAFPSWSNGKILGLSPDGTALWTRFGEGASTKKRGERWDFGRTVPGGDTIEPFWPTKPPYALADLAWDDGRGQGTFYVAAGEWGTDDAHHATLWTLAADGVGERLACDPLVGRIILRGAVAPDGIYVLVLSPTTQYWEIAKITR